MFAICAPPEEIRKRPVLGIVQIVFCIGFAALSWSCDEAVQHVPVTTLESGVNSGKVEQELRLLVISEPVAFNEIHGDIASFRLPTPAPPVVDFAKYRVVIALMEEKTTGGYSIGFGESARLWDDAIEIQVARVSPEENAILSQAITRPYAIAVIERGRYTEIVFVDESGSVLASIESEV